MAKKINEVKVQNRGHVPFSVLEHFGGQTQEWTILPSQEVILHTLPQEIKGENYRFMHIEVSEINIPDKVIEEPKVEVKKPKPVKRKRKTYRRTKK